MTISKVVENLWKMKNFYQMNTEEEEETIVYAIGYLENLDVLTDKIDGISSEWMARKGGVEVNV